MGNGNGSHFRLDIGAVDNDVSASERAHAKAKSAHGNIDRQKQNQINSFDGGIGSDQLGGQRTRVNGLQEASDRHATKVNNTTRDTSTQAINKIRRAAENGLS